MSASTLDALEWGWPALDDVRACLRAASSANPDPRARPLIPSIPLAHGPFVMSGALSHPGSHSDCSMRVHPTPTNPPVMPETRSARDFGFACA
mmetsp:Transcript_36859/g.92121  ORF Transcript_36859/g.92121 Transcript_36859/m.92121 type:complete len:93 (-) Transcript_36859:140-418(-)